MAAAESWHVAQTLRAMELLTLRPRSAPELASALGSISPTPGGMLQRLVPERHVELSGHHRRRYRPTMRIAALAGQLVDRAELAQTALPYVAALRDELGEDCHLRVPSNLSALCLVHQPAHKQTHCRPQLRELVPCHATAAGKTLLAWHGQWRAAVLAQPLEPFTE